jgi:hypothetical protein
MRTKRNGTANANPSAECRELSAEISVVDDRLQELRDRATTPADALSAGRCVALQYVDLIGRSDALMSKFDEIAFELLGGECPHEERICRLKLLVRMLQNVQTAYIRALDGYLSCFGGKEAITMQSTAELIKRICAPVDGDQREINPQLGKLIEKLGDKIKASRKH